MDIPTIIRESSILHHDRQKIRLNVMKVATLGGAFLMLYKLLEQLFFTPRFPIYQYLTFWSSLSFFCLFFMAFTLRSSTHYRFMEITALLVSFGTHVASYILSFAHTLDIYALHQDSILGVSRWNTMNYMIAFSIFPMRRAFIWAISIYTVTASIWLYFIFIYASYDALGLTLFDLSSFLLTGTVNIVFCSMLRRMTSLTTKDQTLAELATTDSLTGLGNRLYLENFLQSMFPKRQQEKLQTSIALCDIDSFKQVNDTYSHAVGDEVLRHFAKVLRRNTSSRDIVGRYGGEEFLLIFLDVSATKAAEICESLRKAVESYDWTQVHPQLKITASFGVSDGTEINVNDTSADMVHQADLKMYRAKNSGRNQVCV